MPTRSVKALLICPARSTGDRRQTSEVELCAPFGNWIAAWCFSADPFANLSCPVLNMGRDVRSPIGAWLRTVAWLLVSMTAATTYVSAQRPSIITLRPANALLNVEDEQFTAITSVRELSDGRVLVADRGENRIALVDLAMNRSSTVGRTGDGPAEYRTVGWLFPLRGDSTLLTDAGARRWLILDGARIVETIPFDRGLTQSLGAALSGTDRLGHVLGLVGIAHSAAAPARRENADSLGVILASRSGLKRDTIARIRGRGSAGLCLTARGRPARRFVSTCNPIATEDLTLLFPDGWVAVVTAEPYRVTWRDPNGRWTQGVPLAYERVALDDREKCALLGRSGGIGIGTTCNSSGYAWPATIPPFLSLPAARLSAPFSPTALATPEGNLLIRTTPTLRNEGTNYDVIDRRGILLSRLVLPANQALVGFGMHSVYIVETTELGLLRLQRHPWP
jgi:hypothetical protein